MSENSSNFGYDIFISYATEDKTIAYALCHYLEEQKIRCWIAPRDILPGQDYAEAIVQTIKKVKIFVLVCSSYSLQSQYVRKETNLAVSEEKIIIPFRIDRCSLDGTPMKLYLNDRHWIDAVPRPEEAFGDLAAAITAFLSSRPERIDDPKPVCPAQPDPKTQYEFDGTFFTKEQILKIAKFLPWLSFAIPVHIDVAAILWLCHITNVFKDDPSGWFLFSMVLLLVLSGVFIYLVLPVILFVRSRFLQKSNRVSTIVLLPVMFFSSPFLISNFFLYYEIQRLRAILHAAGLETSFWGVSKSEITKFVNDSLPPKPVCPPQPGQKTQNEFEGTFFTREQILKIAKFLPRLSFFIPIHINVSVILLIIGLSKIFGNILDQLPSPWRLVLAVIFLIISCVGIFIWLLLPSIFFVRSRLLQKSNLALTIVFLPFVLFSSIVCLSNIFLFYEIQRLRTILHAAGLETSFWGVPKSEITKFADGSHP